MAHYEKNKIKKKYHLKVLEPRNLSLRGQNMKKNNIEKF